MATLTATPKFLDLIQKLDFVVGPSTNSCCPGVKAVLEEIVNSGQDFIGEELLQPNPTGYARRLLYRDPEDRYAVMAMVWGKGQGTALHDHAGKWCVECVYRGRIEVTSYSLLTQEGEDFTFQPESTIYAGVGEAGALIPPFDYHTIANADETPSVTLHIYGGEMDWCHAFVPTEQGFRRERKPLTYTD